MDAATFRDLLDYLVQAPPTQLDPAVVAEIRAWSTPPEAVQIFATLDTCVRTNRATKLVLLMLDDLLLDALEREQTTLEQVVERARWRKTGS